MKDILSGVRKEGDWDDIIEMSDKITRVLEELDIDNEYIEEFRQWEKWRPRIEEPYYEVKQNTAEKASVEKNEAEKDDTPPDEDLKKAGKNFESLYDKFENKDFSQTFKHWKNGVDHSVRATDTVFRKIVRKIEEFVYKNIMTRVAPYYFDNDIINANINKKRDYTFVFEVKFSDTIADEVLNRLEKIEERKGRWHVDHSVEGENQQDVEGIEETENKNNPNPDIDINDDSGET